MSSEILVRRLNEYDEDIVCEMDAKSGYNVVEWLDSEDLAWGAFLANHLIGYCTIGYADDMPDAIAHHPAHTSDSLVLSNVFVIPRFRNHGYGLQLIKGAIRKRWEADEEENTVYLEVLYDGLKRFYEKAGFSQIPDKDDLSCMVLVPEK